MLFIENKISNEELDSITNFFESFENDMTDATPDNSVAKYITSLSTSLYAKSVEDIANTKVGNKVVKKRNLQQVMRESFFYGANRFGNNFIAQRERAEGEGFAVWLVQARQKGNAEDPFNASEQDLKFLKEH